MKTLLLFLILILISNFAYTQMTTIPDMYFEQELINLGLDTGSADGFVPTANIDTVTFLVIDSINVSDLTGIEDFVALNTLGIQNTQVTTVNLIQNTNLTSLVCQFNSQLSNLDVSANTVLNYLECSFNNQLTSLNVSQNTALTVLYCGNNQLSALDISQNTALTDLYCGSNLLTNLDVSQNINLTFLGCDYNQLTSLDVSQNINLTIFGSAYNPLSNLDVTQNIALTELYCQNNQLTTLDVSQNIALNKLKCHDNQLTSLNVKNGNNINFIFFWATSNPNLTCIQVDDSVYSTANWTNIDSQSFFSTNCGVGINETDNFNEIVSVYPNPATNYFNIAVSSSSLNETYLLQLIDVTGKIVQQELVDEGINKISITKLSKGFYQVLISNSSGILTTKKLIIN